MGTTTPDTSDVLIIGAGWSGLYAAKYAKSAGFSVRILESRDVHGGVWNFSELPDVITVMRDTISSSSRHVTEASDFGMPKSVGNFFAHGDIRQYLEEYARHFGVWECIEFNSKVIEVSKPDDDQWRIACQNGNRYKAARLIMCTGAHQKRREIGGAVTAFGGRLHHAGEFKHFDDLKLSDDDHVVVYGGGETASDIINELAKTPARLTWSIKDGQQFFRKTPMRPGFAAGDYDRHDHALDEQTTILHSLYTTGRRSKPGMKYACNFASTGSVLAYQGHGIGAWSNDMPVLRQFMNKNGFALDYVWNNRVTAAPAIESCDGNVINFVDGTSANATHVICCFGYESNLSFLPAWATDVPTHRMYKLVFHPKDPSLAFIGYARPTILSIPFMAELQCLFAARVWTGKHRLPSSAEMMEVGLKDDAKRHAHFLGKRSNPNIVDPFVYMSDITRIIGFSFWSKLKLKKLSLIRDLLVTPLSPLLVRFLCADSGAEEEKRIKEYAFPPLMAKLRREKNKRYVEGQLFMLSPPAYSYWEFHD